MPDRGEVSAQLMLATGVGAELEQGAVAGVEARAHLPSRTGARACGRRAADPA